MIGQTLGHYRIESKLGEGGMGVVYKALDTHLDRPVAIKVLRSEAITNPERKKRFVQEARAASALNHPNILHIYDIDEADGVAFIAMEYVKGQTLDQVIPRKGMRVSEALKYAVQIADALAAAHAAGIIHRDLKPGNLMVTETGLVKILDFGLAKLVERTEGDPWAPTETIKDSPHTEEGSILGTVAYMSPEQAEGKKLDSRSDIFSFGSVLYEMLTGRRPFQGDTRMSTLSAVLSKEPKPTREVAPDLPLELDRILPRCLRKDPARRLQTMADLKVALEELGEESESVKLPSVPAATRKLDRRVAMVSAIVAVLGIGFGLHRWLAAPKPAPFQRMEITQLTATGKATLAAISPDGRYVVHVMSEGGKQSLWMRQVATGSDVQIAPPAEASYFGLTLSRDGNFLYYVTTEKGFGTLYEMPLLGGTAKKLILDVDSPITFSPDGKRMTFIRQSPKTKESAVMIANVDGTGERKLASRKDVSEGFFLVPAWSPDGKVMACSTYDRAGGALVDRLDRQAGSVVLIPAEGGPERPMTSQKWLWASAIAWLSGGQGLIVNAAEQSGVRQLWHLSYPRGEARRITNDLNHYRGISLTAGSDALVTVERHGFSNIWTAPNGEAAGAKQITSGMGRDDGKEGTSWVPDGRIVYVSRGDIWFMGPDGNNPKQLTRDTHISDPRVSPDGRYIAFASDRSGNSQIWRMEIDGSNPKQLTNGSEAAYPHWSPDGKWVVYASVGLWRVSVDGGSPVQLTDRFDWLPSVSPDGKKVAAFRVDEHRGVVVVPFDGGTPTQFLDINSNVPVRWTPDGSALLYVKDQGGVSNIWSQPVAGGPPRQVTDFNADQIFNFDLSRDGKQLALARGAASSDVVLIRDLK